MIFNDYFILLLNCFKNFYEKLNTISKKMVLTTSDRGFQYIQQLKITVVLSLVFKQPIICIIIHTILFLLLNKAMCIPIYAAEIPADCSPHLTPEQIEKVRTIWNTMGNPTKDISVIDLSYWHKREFHHHCLKRLYESYTSTDTTKDQITKGINVALWHMPIDVWGDDNKKNLYIQSLQTGLASINEVHASIMYDAALYAFSAACLNEIPLYAMEETFKVYCDVAYARFKDSI